jgi:hypothetical protein
VHRSPVRRTRRFPKSLENLPPPALAQKAHAAGDNPIAKVVSLNLHRRHLTPSQISLVGVAIDRLKRGGWRGNQWQKVERPSATAPTRKEIAALLGIGETTVDRAAIVLQKGAPYVIQAVEKGEVKVNTAYAAIKGNPKEAQET